MKKKPISPHLQIYRPQITTVLSIMHRFTGVGLVIGIILFTIAFASFASAESAWKSFIKIWHLSGGSIWQWGLIFSLHYHVFNGIRHLAWDTGYGFELKDVVQSGFAVLILSIIATLAFAHFCSII
ncbi:MAG: succinate dehydrogenase, cytochrome b556 subunit [Candidatus Paracaedibacteraceae bacterium]|nr:succinate dehydrogenase, cytochrome b556 subunit [Candidatus Paracaedibacteraceae bacterium]